MSLNITSTVRPRDQSPSSIFLVHEKVLKIRSGASAFLGFWGQYPWLSLIGSRDARVVVHVPGTSPSSYHRIFCPRRAVVNLHSLASRRSRRRLRTRCG
ncbi:hypothetical protein M413DRAFT_292098 [Hebeloma cylindrosporum]|uniref:Uncharacterized protein n=1 Tax=Hebeloma cylindrosporum TaxID=76867 RepID=A0A0C3BY37_HEBCY|nr:hypothetical protein M413DRAFT_292098 [Hebeloma cylindrosporum h7]